MFGSFSAGDSLRVYRLQRKGVSLDLQRELTQPGVPLWEAWLAFLTQQAMGQPTYIVADLHTGYVEHLTGMRTCISTCPACIPPVWIVLINPINIDQVSL